MALIEQHQEVAYERNIADVRSWDQKYAEQLSQPLFFAGQAAVLLVLMLAVKAFLFVWLLGFVILLSIHLSYRVILPLRYPPDVKDPKGKNGDGIMYFGSLRSKNPFQNFQEIWQSDADLRTHFLILGSTGSGKSETLKGMFYNSLCWGSGFFLADGKADNKMPTDIMSMCRMHGVDDDFLGLNFLIGGSSPEKIRASRRRRTNMINTFSDSDADTQIQMGANLLPKAEGEGKSWQEKALNFWRSLVVALCYKRDTQGFELSVGTYIDHMGLPKVEELYAEGYREYIANGEWSYGFVGIKSYCESGGCPGFMVDRVLAKYNLPPDPNSASRTGLPNERGPGGRGGMAAPQAQAGKPAQKTEQDQATYDQHGYRIGQLMPALNLLDKTYGHIFRAKYSEIDMVDVALNNRVLVMMIPSLEKSASEAENLGKLAIACLRVMMGRNLGADIEGHRSSVLESKATEANYPFLVALDELGYYFSDGIAVMFAQARSLGMSMCALAQDIEKLTEGSRQAEAGAMLANAVAKFFMRIDDAQKTWKLIADYVGKARVAVYDAYELAVGGFSREKSVRVEQVDRVTLEDMQKMGAGQGVLNTRGKTIGVNSFYVGDYLDKHKQEDYRLPRFLQVRPVTMEEVYAYSIPADAVDDSVTRGQKLLDILTYRTTAGLKIAPDTMLTRLELVASKLPRSITGSERGAALYVAAKKAIDDIFAKPATGGSAKRITDQGVGEVVAPRGLGEGADAARVAGMPGFGLGNLNAAAPGAQDESVDMPTPADFAGHRAPVAPLSEEEGLATARAVADTYQPVEASAEPQAESLLAGEDVDPLAYLDGPVLERRPVEELLAPLPQRRAAAAAPTAAAAAPAPAAPATAPAATARATGFGRPASPEPQAAPPVAPATPVPGLEGIDDPYLAGLYSGAPAPAAAPAQPPAGTATDGFAIFDELDRLAAIPEAPLPGPVAAPPVPARRGFGNMHTPNETHASHELEEREEVPSAADAMTRRGFGPATGPRVAASSLNPSKTLSLRAKTSIATIVEAGRGMRPRPNFAVGGISRENLGTIERKPAAASAGSATLGQSENWVAKAMVDADTRLSKVGPDAIGFDNDTRAGVARVEAELGASDPITASLNTERIVAASVTPTESVVELTQQEVEDGIEDTMSLLG